MNGLGLFKAVAPQECPPPCRIGRVNTHPFLRDMQEGRALQRLTGHCASISVDEDQLRCMCVFPPCVVQGPGCPGVLKQRFTWRPSRLR
eukprot:10138671-Lingulodinium_polyedra.AAC.1